MDLEHLQDRLLDGISRVESSLASLGYVEVEYMTTEEFTDALQMLELVEVGIENFARRILDREPSSPAVEAAVRQFEQTWRAGRETTDGDGSICTP
jgi:hypothetical protein